MVERADKAAQPRVAAIDVGTNTIRLVVAEVEPDGNYRVLDEERAMTRLGRGLYATGRLSRASVERSLETLCKMCAIAQGFEVQELRAVATSALREAANGAAFRQAAQRRCGLRIEVISSEEEAEFAVRSVMRHFHLESPSLAIVDIGGGSMEVVLVAEGVVNQVHSLPLGAVRLTEEFGKSDPLKDKHWGKLKKAVDRRIKDEIGRPPFYPDVMVGSGGTFTNIGEMIQCEREGRFGPIRGYEVARADLDRLVARLRETPLGARRRLCGLNPKRADIMPAGATAVARLARKLGSQRIVVNDCGIRDGLLQTMIEELGAAGAQAVLPAPDRIQWVREFARKCRSNERHCDQVARLSVALFDALREPFEIPSAGRDILEAAALLHDVGYLVNHAKHHKHAYHLIMHGDLRGFSPGDVELIANVARYHRRAMPKKSHENFARLDRPDRELVRQLSGILRVADGLDRTHAQAIERLEVAVEDGVVRIGTVAPEHPHVDLADAERKGALFEKAFGVALELTWQRSRKRNGRSRGALRGGQTTRGSAEPRRM
jgi:exopolyphosphatase/guanosine-5'-triphosphate,3'-diphosphate pyrophosphatase